MNKQKNLTRIISTLKISTLILSIQLIINVNIIQAQSFNGEPIGLGWRYVGNPGFAPEFASQIDLLFDSTDKPYFSFINFSTPQKPSVMTLVNNTWMHVGNSEFSDYDAMNLSMKLDKTGNPYVVFEDLQQNAKGAVYYLEDSIWESVDTLSAPGYVFWRPSITFDINNTLFLSYYDPFDYKIIVRKLINSQWVDAGFPTDFINQGTPVIFTKPNGEIYIAHFFYEAGVYNLKLFKKENNIWVLVPTGNVLSDHLSYCQLYISPNGELYLAGVLHYYPNSNYASVQKLEGNNWQYLGSPQISEANTTEVLMAINKNEQPIIIYSSPDATWYTTNILVYKNNTWESLDTTGNNPDYNGMLGLSFNNNNVLHIATIDEYSGGLVSIMSYDTLYAGINYPDQIKESFFSIAPNPVQTELHINSKVEINTVKIFNLTGQLVFANNYKCTSATILTSNMKPGIYFVQVSNSKSTEVKKILKE